MLTDDELHKVRRMLDEREIYQVIVEYCRAIDRNDPEGILKVYHPGAQEDHGPYKGSAFGYVEFVCQAVAGLAEGWTPVNWQAHHICNVLMEFPDDETAHVESSFIFGTSLANGSDIDIVMWGRYLDVFKKSADWRISDRTVVVDSLFEVPSTPGGHWLKSGFLQGAMGKTDPLYELISTK